MPPLQRYAVDECRLMLALTLDSRLSAALIYAFDYYCRHFRHARVMPYCFTFALRHAQESEFITMSAGLRRYARRDMPYASVAAMPPRHATLRDDDVYAAYAHGR